MKIKGFALRCAKVKSKAKGARVTRVSMRTGSKRGASCFVRPGPFQSTQSRGSRPNVWDDVAQSWKIITRWQVQRRFCMLRLQQLAQRERKLLRFHTPAPRCCRARWFSVNIYARETPPGAKLSGRHHPAAGFAKWTRSCGLKKYPHETRRHAFEFLCMHGISETTHPSGCVQKMAKVFGTKETARLVFINELQYFCTCLLLVKL